MSSVNGVTVSSFKVPEHLTVDMMEREGQLRLSLTGRSEDSLLRVLDTCAATAIDWANGFQVREAEALAGMIARRLMDTERELSEARKPLEAQQRAMQIPDMEHEVSVMAENHARLERRRSDLETQLETTRVQIENLLTEISRHHPALLEARQDLDKALLEKTEEHQEVKELQARLQRLQERLSQQTAEVDPVVALHESTLAQELYGQVLKLRATRAGLEQELAIVSSRLRALRDAWISVPDAEASYARNKARRNSLQEARDFLLKCDAEAKLLLAQAPQSLRVLHPSQVEPRDPASRWTSALLVGAGGGTCGAMLAIALLAWFKGRSLRILSSTELAQVTQLPLLASLKNVDAWTAAEKQHWAFETLTALKGRMNKAPRDSLVCGFVSARHGEGRTTWVNLLAESARERGYRVLTLSSGQSNDRETEWGAGRDRHPLPALMPAEIGEMLQGSAHSHRVDLLTGDWVWNLQCRQQWQEALRQCHQSENLVVLVDLPPISEPESLLLAENLSQVIWLCGQDMAEMDETRKWIDMLHHAHADVVGTVFNQPMAKARSRHRKAAAIIGCAMALLGSHLSAQDPVAPPPTQEAAVTNVAAMSVNSPSQLAAWQKRLTLGPGDTLDLQVYGKPDTLRLDMSVGPDGRMNYLQARGVTVAGLSVDELRTALENVLTNYYQPPIRVIAIPRSFQSKKYFLLGNVKQRGVYPLNQPLTIMEAIAKAGGFESQPENRTTFLLTDLSRSFLVRKGEEGKFQRMDVNFENLFLRGDLSQNLPLAPEDYLYFPPLDVHEVYVLGEVFKPGATRYLDGASVMRVIAFAGGFKDKAYRSKVLVLRGSLDDPEGFIINVNEVLNGETPDFKLVPGDIVYISRRPWAVVEELAELAISEFLRAAIVTWTGQNVGPFIDDPLIE